MEPPEEVQQAIEEWNSNKALLLRSYEQVIMYLDRAGAAHKREAERSFFSLYAEIIKALFFGVPWPWADAQMWDKQVKRAEQRIRELEREQRAIEKEHHLIVVTKESEA